MYKKSFYINKQVGNNAFSFEKRKNKKLYVASLKKIDNFDEISLGDEVVFEDFDFDGKLSSCKGLKNFYEISPLPNPPPKGEGTGKSNITAPIYLFDNHNHALYFWYLARKKGIIGDNNTLYHVDEHSDMRDPLEYLTDKVSHNIQKVFEYTNFSKINVGNYIIPAQKQGLIKDIIQIRNEQNLLTYLNSPSPVKERGLGGEVEFYSEEGAGGLGNIILNLDLDFFQPDLDFIDYELKKKVILDIAKKSTVITVATSPFFINQTLALKVFKDMFTH